MTVAQLIKSLQELPQDLPVYLADWNEGYAPDSPIGDLAPRVEEEFIANGATCSSYTVPRRVVIG